MSKRFANHKQQKFLTSRPTCDIQTSDIGGRCKFNFSYFETDQAAAQSFADWQNNTGAASLTALLDKLKEFSKAPLSYWHNSRVGSGGLTLFEYYGSFPAKSDFEHPKHVPHDVIWARFRLSNHIRLIGFTIPDSLHDEQASEKNCRFDSNTFYVVFLDKDHRFYKTS